MKDGERKASARKKNKGQEHIVKLIKSVSTVLVILILLFIMADKFGNITFFFGWRLYIVRCFGDKTRRRLPVFI